MADRIFVYNELARGEQELIPPEARSATNDVEVQLHNPEQTVIRFQFADVPDVPNRVTVRFKDLDTGAVFVPEVPVEGPAVNQVYLLGHGLIVPSGVIARITGQTEGPGQGVMVDYNLDVTAVDQLLALGITGHSIAVPAHFDVELLHDGNAEITYQASITIGDLEGG